MVVAQVNLPMGNTGYSLIALLASLVSVCAPIGAKCPMLFVGIEGEIRGVTSDDTRLEVEVSPDPNALQDTISIGEGMFSGRIRFDTTKSGGRFHHNCSRRPLTVQLTLLRGDDVLKQVVLDVAGDFMTDENGDYFLENPWVIDIDTEGDPEEEPPDNPEGGLDPSRS